MAEQEQQMLPRWLRSVVLLLVVGLWLVYMTAPLLNIEADMPALMGPVGVICLGYALGKDIWDKMRRAQQ